MSTRHPGCTTSGRVPGRVRSQQATTFPPIRTGLVAPGSSPRQSPVPFSGRCVTPMVGMSSTYPRCMRGRRHGDGHARWHRPSAHLGDFADHGPPPQGRAPCAGRVAQARTTRTPRRVARTGPRPARHAAPPPMPMPGRRVHPVRWLRAGSTPSIRRRPPRRPVVSTARGPRPPARTGQRRGSRRQRATRPMLPYPDAETVTTEPGG